MLSLSRKSSAREFLITAQFFLPEPNQLRVLRSLFLLILLGLVALGYAVYYVTSAPLPLQAGQVSFTIPPGVGLRTAAERMTVAGVDVPAWSLVLVGQAMQRANQIKAGSYEIERGITAVELIDKLVRGDVALTKVTFIEGKTFRELRQVLAANPDLRQDSASLSEAKLREMLGISAPGLEGMFFPDTYLLAKQSSDIDALRQANAALEQNLQSIWAARDPTLPLKTPYEMLILASIVEKETGTDADRPPIAAVFVNRMRIGMPLQSDPTVIYGLGQQFDGNLRRVHLIADTPWNTYTRRGLPPTPIALTGLEALHAVSRPPPSEHFYFVARGDGSSQFSPTLDAHNRAVARYQRGNSK
jgi:UPF0755 protein